MDTNTTIKAFNQAKPLIEWGFDSRCKVDIDLVAERIEQGLTPEEAMMLPDLRSIKPRKTPAIRTPQMGSTDLDLRARRQRPYLTRHRRQPVTVEAFGEAKTIHDWTYDPRCNVYPQLLRARLVSGWDPEEAITKPPHKPEYR
jgi:hypothetical protein